MVFSGNARIGKILQILYCMNWREVEKKLIDITEVAVSRTDTFAEEELC